VKSSDKQRERERRTCQHFSGIQHDTCKRGVRYLDVRINDGESFPFPCASNNERGHCDQFVATTNEQINEREARITRALDLIEQGLSACCEAPLDLSHVITDGQYKGHGPRFCSKCQKLAFMV